MQALFNFEKADTQRGKVLDALKSARSIGCTSADLNAICFRFGARIFELRKSGYRISTEHEGDLARYKLAPEHW